MRIEHVAIWTKDLERLKEFYTRFFGAVSGRRYDNPLTGFSSYFLTFDRGCRLELMSLSTVEPGPDNRMVQHTGYIHLALSVGSRDEVDRLTRSLSEAGYPALDGPRETGDGYYESCVVDADGNRVEITV